MSKARERILCATKTLFYKQGYNATGINQVIEEADIAKSTLFQHFATKEDLCKHYLQQTSDDTISYLEQLLSGKGSEKTKINKLYENLRNDVINKEFRGCHFHNIISEISDKNEVLFPIVQTHKEKLRMIFHKIFEADTDKSFADFAFILFEGTLIQCQIQQQQWPIDSAKQTMNKLLEERQKA
ncbi:TetR/AcrR family transcriptional regulator [Olivibacter sitiensis]|uniref:TetR/AcrR family transcriptional regulator n=1 Tax=Olivibacter sitiensis TaxID=376470 RepID=UPI00042550F9|nr:TetR/AcrR family transcriptional regulator [Olivibacter sitiensis]